MTTLTPKQMLAYTTDMAERVADIKTKAVFVGLPAEKVGGAVYGGGMTVLQIGAIHEYGVPQQGVPERSFLRTPFRLKRDEINAETAKQFEAVITGKRSVAIGLGRIGIIAVNIAKGAFVSKGYGSWADIKPATKKRKGSSQPLIDTGVLRSSISSVVRDAT